MADTAHSIILANSYMSMPVSILFNYGALASSLVVCPVGLPVLSGELRSNECGVTITAYSRLIVQRT